jgi:hypothetical protein
MECQRWDIAPAPFHLQPIETDQQPNDKSCVQQRKEEDPGGSQDLPEDLLRAEPEQGEA